MFIIWLLIPEANAQVHEPLTKCRKLCMVLCFYWWIWQCLQYINRDSSSSPCLPSRCTRQGDSELQSPKSPSLLKRCSSSFQNLGNIWSPRRTMVQRIYDTEKEMENQLDELQGGWQKHRVGSHQNLSEWVGDKVQEGMKKLHRHSTSHTMLSSLSSSPTTLSKDYTASDYVDFWPHSSREHLSRVRWLDPFCLLIEVQRTVVN